MLPNPCMRLPLEPRKKARTDKSGRKEGKAEGKAAGSSRKQPSTLPCLDYVVVSDTLSGLGVGERSRESDSDDSATLTEHMRKKALEDHKRKLDEQSAALLAAKKAKLHKEAPRHRLNLRLILVFLVGVVEIFWRRSMLRLLLLLTGKKPRVVDISQITSPASPPSRTVGLTSPRYDVEVGKKSGEGATEDVGEGGGDAGVVDGADKGKGIETEVESSETTPRQTIFTRRTPSGDGATSGAVRNPEFEKSHADSWDTRNPACDDLPHVPRWNLTQGSRMTDLANCHDFFSMSLPPAERLFQKRRNRFELRFYASGD
ncbi:hypothetical protein Hanom_Chr04g00297821 [Helianthus anomalus]